MDHPKGFLDSIEFWDDNLRGLAYGDSVDEGKPYLLRTEDEGESWSKISPDYLPASDKGEAN